jgi:hypothetical protein
MGVEAGAYRCISKATNIERAMRRRFKPSLRMVQGTALLISAALALPCASQALKMKLPSATTGGVSLITGSSGTLAGSVNPHGVGASYYFQYGPTVAYGAQTPTTSAGAGTTTVKLSQPISGLQLGSTYHYRLVVLYEQGQTADGQDRAFTTKSLPLKFEIGKALGPVQFGSPLSINGTLTGTGASNRQVVLEANPYPYSGRFTAVGSPVLTNAEGGFSFSVASLSQNTKLRVATLDVPPVSSPIVTEHIAVRVTLHAHPTGHRGYVRLYGTVSPAILDGEVTFQLVRPGLGLSAAGGTVVKRGTSRVSRFSSLVYIRHGRGGSYRAYVKVVSGSLASGPSRTVLLRSAPASARRKAR